MAKLSRRDILKITSVAAGGALAARALPRRLLRAGQADKPNVLILLFDTMSAPHLSLYGYRRNTAPNFARFAERAIVYHAHYSGGCYTIPGTATILTGLYPWHHRAVNPSSPMRRDLVDANLFRAVGTDYYRIGYGQNMWAELFLRQFHADLDLHLPADSFAFRNPMLLGRINRRDPMAYIAFDDFLVGGVKLDTPYPGSATLGLLDLAAARGRNTDRDLKKRDSRATPFNGYFYYENRAVFDGIYETIRAAEGRGQPYLGYFHFWAPHGPYAPTEEFTGLFADGAKVPRKPLHPLIERKAALPDKALDAYSRAYDQYIANVDAEFGRLLDRLQAESLLDNTWIVLLSDHGQLFERGVHGHSSRLVYDQGIHVPLLISAPGQSARVDVRVPTSNADILPSLLALTGGQPPARLDGALLPGLGGGGTERPVFAMDAKESSAFRPLDRASFVLMRGAHKLILYTGYPGYEDLLELYELESDPGELRNLAKADPITAGRLLDELNEARHAADAPFTRLKGNQ